MLLRGERSGAVDVVFDAAGSASRMWEPVRASSQSLVRVATPLHPAAQGLMEETGGLGVDFVVECDHPSPVRKQPWGEGGRGEGREKA